MNWISENKFLAGFFGFMIVGIGVLGYLLFGAMGDYDTVHQGYTDRVTALAQLEELKPYRDQSNLEKYKQQKTALADAIHTLEQNVSTVQFPLDATVTPAGFQDALRTSVNKALADAKTNNVKLPDKFALGFDQYLTSPPVQGAAAPLGRELKAVEFVVDELLTNKVESISAPAGPPGATSAASGIIRNPLPEESGAKPSKELVVKSRLQVSFVAEQYKFRKILNDLAETKKQFYIVRLVEVKNQNPKQLGKKEAQEMSRPKPLYPVLGMEKLEVTLTLEIVNFNPPQK